ncbi:MAG: DUF4349 domain-containing protein [Bacteroidetes bacterium]|nr:DUF4349 domain-containing protein [Bacteroidota bacterium]
MTPKLILAAFVSLLILPSCGGRGSNFDAEAILNGGFESSMAESAPPPPPPPPPGVVETVKFTPPVTSEEYDKSEAGSANASGLTSTTTVASAPIKMAEKIKKTADVDISVEDYKVARAAIDKIVKTGNGYISGENEQNSTYSISNAMTIRVANKDFDAMVSNLAGVASHVNSKNVYMEDVTAEFVDITARLKTKKEVEKRYLELLQKAVKVTDILEVEEHLRGIREEIEAKEGQLKLLNDQVAFSTINLNFTQSFEYTPQDEPGFFGRMGKAFGNGWKGFLSFVIGLVYVWPLWLILGLTTYFVVKFIKKKLKK